MNDRLYRSREDRVIGGVCAGVADRLDLDPSLVRVGWAILTILTGGALLVLYIVMLIVVPEEPLGGIPPASPAPGPGAVPGWQPPGTEGQTGWPVAGAAGAVGAAGAAGAAGMEPPPGWQAPGSETGQPAGWQPPPATAAADGSPVPAWTPPDQAYAARRAARVQRHRRNEGLIGLVIGVLLILAGAWFLLRQYLPDIDFDAFWPIVIIALGLLFVVLAFRPGRGGDVS